MKRAWIAGVLCLAASGCPVFAQQESCDGLRAEKTKTYGFHPAQMSETDIEAKSKELNAFWKNVQNAGPEGASCLKGMLAEEKTDHNFQFDAGSMLFQLDPAPENLILIRDSIGQTDFQETDPAAYLALALALSQNGVDIQGLAARLLRFPNAVIHIPEHSLDLDSDTAALFLYGSMPVDQADKALTKELSAPEPVIRSTAAHLLGEQLNEESFRTLSKWDGLGKVEEDFRRNDIQAVMKYQAPTPAELAAKPKFTREQVLKSISQLPHTRKEFDDLMATKGAEFDKQMRDMKATQEQISKAVAEGEPVYGIANRTAFMASAVATLKAEDLEALREARKKALLNISDESLDEYLAFTQVMIGLINRMDLFREYRVH
ncbi:MAG TPA: hypothetical protein VGF19_14220 [Candidatus Acidoferrum sp.]